MANGDQTEPSTDDLVARELELLAEEQPGPDGDSAQGGGGVDLRTLLEEMARLRAELRAETRSVRELRDAVTRQGASPSSAPPEREAAAGGSSQVNEAGRASMPQPHREAAEPRAETGRRAMEALVDMADRLEASLQSADEALRRPPRRWKAWLGWRWRQRPLRSIRDGLELTLGRMRYHLARVGIERVETKGRAFDPHTMEAVDTVARNDLGDGQVAEEVGAGYLRDGELMRAAKVIVNRARG